MVCSTLLIDGLPLLSEQAAKEAAVLLLTGRQLFEPGIIVLHCLELFFQKRPDVRIQIRSSNQLLNLLDSGLVLGRDIGKLSCRIPLSSEKHPHNTATVLDFLLKLI